MFERFRPLLEKVLSPIAKELDINPNIITIFSLIIAVIAAVSFALNSLIVGGVLLFLSGLLDVFDGAIARYHNKVTKFGAFLDSTTDRFSDTLIIIGLLAGGYTTWVLGVLAIHSSITVSYVRAIAESKGIPCTVGIGERATRLIILIVGAFIASYLGKMYMSIAILTLVFLAYITVIQRIVHVWNWTKKQKFPE
ncbi:MAG: CDP-alcohol phosphatidyltransferase family protein [Methanobacteriaceae archaeon]|jgi:archaetidylinositol phosphate synthase|nr:CDP-alcohol phosphatidyltransferase family protein [Candidatus Methanorudis spinitermitis]